MTRVLIVSDSHGFNAELKKLVEAYDGKVDAMIHCGDSELDYDAKPMAYFDQKVTGNCDYDPDYPDEAVFTVGDFTYFVAHGHMHQVKTSLDPISYRASERGAQIVCHGHSHLAHATKRGDQLIINPGSIRLPRGRQEETYAILTAADHEINVHFYQLDGREVEDLAVSMQL